MNQTLDVMANIEEISEKLFQYQEDIGELVETCSEPKTDLIIALQNKEWVEAKKVLGILQDNRTKLAQLVSETIYFVNEIPSERFPKLKRSMPEYGQTVEDLDDAKDEYIRRNIELYQATQESLECLEHIQRGLESGKYQNQ